MPSLTEYLKQAGIYKPQPGSLAEVLAKPEVKKKKMWTYHYPDFKTGKPVSIEATSQTEARKQAEALGLPTTEVLSTWKKKPALAGVQKGVTESQKRLQEIQEQMGVGAGAEVKVGDEVVEEVKEEKEEVAPLTGLYDVSKIQTDLTTASTSKKSAYDEMIGLQSKLYEDEYNKAGMGDVKSKIATIDTEISDRKAKRDQSLLTEKGKPIPQWMITGRKALEIEAATSDLNRLIDQRNGLADQYNSGIDEVTRKVGYGTQDAATKYGYWESEEKRLTDLMGTYQALMVTELGRAEELERWEKEFALKLSEAEKAEKPKTASITYTSGGRLYLRTYNAETGETIKTEDLGPAAIEPGKAPADIETYARDVLTGRLSLSGIPADIRTQVSNKVNELKKTERIYTDEQIRAEIRGWMMDVKSKYETATDEEIKSAIRDAITKSELTDLDRERFYLILGEITEEKAGGIGSWLKEEIWKRLPGVK